MTVAIPTHHSGQGLSLKRQLLLWLLLPQLVLFLVGGALAYRIALKYAEKAIDQSLTQSVRSLARQVKPMRVALLEVDYGDAASPQRMRVQVAKSLAVQQRLTTELIADMLAPLLLLVMVLSTLVYGGISRGLRPLKRLQAQLGDRHDQALSDLSPIEMTQAPQEVHALAEKDPQALRARLTKVLAGAQRSAHLVHQLLSLACNEVEVDLQPLDVAALAREVARDWTPRALKAGIDLGFEGADHLILPGEAFLLREALINLIDNALTYAGTGCEVTIKVQSHGDLGLLEVADNGTGLSGDDLSHVFERFWRASDLPGGCGLGLAIVAEIAQRHGGQARVLAARPHGLRVQLWLPISHDAAAVS